MAHAACVLIGKSVELIYFICIMHSELFIV